MAQSSKVVWKKKYYKRSKKYLSFGEILILGLALVQVLDFIGWVDRSWVQSSEKISQPFISETYYWNRPIEL